MKAATPPRLSTREIILGTLLVGGMAAGFYFLIQFSHILFTIFLGLTLSVALEPAVTWLQGYKVRRRYGSIIVHLGLLVISAGILAIIVPMVLSQASTIVDRLPGYYQSIREQLIGSPAALIRTLGSQFPAEMQDLFSTVINIDSKQGTPSPLVGETLSVLFDLLIVLLLSFYWTLDSERTTRLFLLQLPESKREGIRETISTFKEKVGAYLRGQALLCLVVGLLSLVAYFLIGMPYAFSLALISGIFEAIPMIGPVLGLVPAVVLALAISPDKIVWVIIAGLVIQQVENNLLVPRVMDRSVGVNPVVSILAIGAFSLLFGIMGAILAIPVTAVLQVMLDRFVFSNPDLLPTAEASPSSIVKSSARITDPAVVQTPAPGSISGVTPTEADAPVTASRDRLSVLHLELHELTQDIRKQQRSKDSADPMTDEIEDQIEAAAEKLYTLMARHSQNRPSTQPSEGNP